MIHVGDLFDVLPTLEAHRIYAITCHLHPPHRGATLMVVPGR